MTVSTVSAGAREKSPIISTANKVNAITSTKRKKTRDGEMVVSKAKAVRIGKNVRVFSTKSQLISRVKQGDPQYDIIKRNGDGFRFYGSIVEADSRKGWWVCEYDLFPTEAKRLRISRNQCTTVRDGDDEPQHHPRNDKIAQAIADIEVLEESDAEDFDLVLHDSDDDIEEEDGANKPKKKKKVTRKLQSLNSFLNMSDDGVLDATTFDHYWGEGDNDFIRWEILKEGEEISEDVMKHPPPTSQFSINIPWTPTISRNDYFQIFYDHFFPSLVGKAALLDKYLSSERCSAYLTVQHDKIKFHRPDHPDPDFLVSTTCCCCWYQSSFFFPFLLWPSSSLCNKGKIVCHIGNCSIIGNRAWNRELVEYYLQRLQGTI